MSAIISAAVAAACTRSSSSSFSSDNDNMFGDTFDDSVCLKDGCNNTISWVFKSSQRYCDKCLEEMRFDKKEDSK